MSLLKKWFCKMMQVYTYPEAGTWRQLTVRPKLMQQNMDALVQEIFAAVLTDGDAAVQAYTTKFDKIDLPNIRVSAAEIENADAKLDEHLKQAIQLAIKNVRAFHAAQLQQVNKIETAPGVICWRENRAIETVGLYIPGGTAPLFSTVIMLGVPAQIAGCRQTILCSPPDANGNIHPAILYTANQLGITAIFKTGGIQAIAAMATGTETIPKCYKLFGPGNQYVTAAKSYAQQLGVAIDMPAGPSEVLVIADATANPAFVAADLLSQAEHGTDSQVILVSTDQKLIDDTNMEIEKQISVLPRKEIAKHAMENSWAVLLTDLDACVAFSNTYAPEHLILATANPEKVAGKVLTAGSVFLGSYSCESVGDYASGTNHTLPTNGYAKSYSGVSVDSFVKKITFQHVNANGIKNIGPAVIAMAEAEGLQAHANAVKIRLQGGTHD